MSGAWPLCAAKVTNAERTWNRKRGDDQLAVADLVHDHAADDDAEAEAGEARAADGAELGAGEAEFRRPVVEDAAANGEADAGGENGHEAGPEEPFGIRDYAWVVGVGSLVERSSCVVGGLGMVGLLLEAVSQADGAGRWECWSPNQSRVRRARRCFLGHGKELAKRGAGGEAGA